jgi:hypothetical protein
MQTAIYLSVHISRIGIFIERLTEDMHFSAKINQLGLSLL